ncbi:MAG: transporter [Limisphaerales bacterium]
MRKSLLALPLVLAAAPAFSHSAWLPAEGRFIATPVFAWSSFDSFWMGETKVDNPPNGKSLDQYTGYLAMEYGLIGALALDAAVGYTGTDTDAFGGASDDGIADTLIGLRYGLSQERPGEWWPTTAVRLGGVIPGNYDENTPFAPGDGVWGLEAQFMVAKEFGGSGFGTWGDIGYRVRGNPAPDDFLAAIGVYQKIGPVTVSAGYRHIEGLDGLDIGGPGFNPGAGEESGFPALKEINQLFEGSVSYRDAGDRRYAVTVAKSIDGRNTGDKLILGFAVSLPFGGR